MRKAIFDVTVAGTNISTALRPILLGMSITDNAGTHSDTANIDIDDTGGRIIFPDQGADVVILLGWEDEGAREVFRGTVDEIRSSGNKSGGRTLALTAKGVDTTGKAKEGQDRHFDGKTVKDILTEAGGYAGISEIDVDPDLAGVTLPYIDMRSESFLHLGERLGAMLGGSFRVQGTKATMARRAAGYAASVTAQAGVNLISWDITPKIGRARYGKARAKSYDMKAATEVVSEAETGLDGAEAAFVRRDLMADPGEAQRAADGDAATSQEMAGGGSVEIDGNTGAVPDGQCVLVGARPGIDGTYLIKAVTHSFTRGGGFTTTLQLAQPQGDAGKDQRGGTGPTSGNTDYREVIGEMSGEQQ
jgi:hypothetical protein